MQESEKDPLDRLFIKSGEIDRQLLADLLVKYVRIDEKGNIFPQAGFYSETNKAKVMLILLAKKAISLKVGVDEAVAPKDLAKLIDMPEGSLRPTLRALVDDRIAEENESRYRVFPYAVVRCAELLKDPLREKPIPQFENKSTSKKVGMREAIQGLMDAGLLNEPKTAREIHAIIVQRRPGTLYNPLYKVILDMVQQQKIGRELQEGTWKYAKVSR